MHSPFASSIFLASCEACPALRRDAELSVALHDRKPLEWIDKLETWLVGAEAEVHRQVQLQKAARRAQEMQSRSG